MRPLLKFALLATGFATACSNSLVDQDLNTSTQGFTAVRHNMKAQVVSTGVPGFGVPGTSGMTQGAAYERYQNGQVYKPKAPGTADVAQPSGASEG